MESVKTDCRHYKGAIPCSPHKTAGVHCNDCTHYQQLGERLLIIKLGAIGDVIRTTPLLVRLRKELPSAEITWLTYSPEVIPEGWVDNVLDFSLPNVVWLQQQQFDWIINLDKDREAIALAERLSASRKSGFKMNRYGKCIPMGSVAENRKWLTGLWDDVNRANTLNYMEEIFSICGYDFAGEEYIVPFKSQPAHNHGKSMVVVGLNTGCGARWPTRLWPEERWSELASSLMAKGYETVLLGGPQEDAKNQKISRLTGATYHGVKPLGDFFGSLDACDVVVTQVTMATHVAIALKKHVILLNNIFNRNEFFLYGNGCIIEPDLDCLGCFKQRFDSRCPVSNCMELISVQSVMSDIERRKA
jgi:ADP-heptose:LPS heptosyltransferase